MEDTAQTLPKKSLPDPIRRELKKGETIYHSTLPCHVSAKNPEGKWIAQVRREEKGKLVKYPVKGYATPREALNYIKTLRPDEKGRVAVALPGEPKVRDLYEYAKKHRQKRLTENTKAGRESRWRLYIEQEWADVPLSKVTRRAAQEWITTVENSILNGESGNLGIGQFEKVRTDLHWMFEALPSFSSDYEDRRNPFAGLDFLPRLPRNKVTIECQHFAAVEYACRRFAEEGVCTQWISEVFLTSLLSGLREGEVLALCRDQLDFSNGAIVVDRALRRNSRAIDPKTRREVGPVLRLAINLPKGGSVTNDKTRVVPMSDQLMKILKRAHARPGVKGAAWDLLWSAEAGNLREVRRFQTAWKSLKQRLDELATLVPLEGQQEPWPEAPKRHGWIPNPVVPDAKSDAALRLPDIFHDIDFRDTRNSFASYMNELGLSQATREHILGHGGGLTNTVYTVVTSGAFQDARKRLSAGWKPIKRIAS